MLTNILLYFLFCSLAFGNDRPIAKTSFEKIAGQYDKSLEGKTYMSYIGIPYAPLGNLRFCEPKPGKVNDVLWINSVIVDEAIQRVKFFQDGDKYNKIPKEFKKGLEDEASRNLADKTIDEVKNDGEIGLPHLGSVSDAYNKPIEIYDKNDNLVHVIGADKPGLPLKAQYHPPKGSNGGHWTLPNNTEPNQNSTRKNDCFDKVIGQQTGDKPEDVRKNIVNFLEKNKLILANQAMDVERLKKIDSVLLQYGGATYKGTNPNDARRVLDKSQGTQGEGYTNLAHPNGHVDNPRARARNFCQEKIKNVQSYSADSDSSKPKTAFISPQQQANVVHKILSHKKAKANYTELNNGKLRTTLELSRAELGLSRDEAKMSTFVHGAQTKTSEFTHVVTLLQHHKGQRNNKDYDVQVFTCYPVNRS